MLKRYDPGRPAAGKSKKNICECPKKCTCLDGDKCDCPRDCTCIIFAVYLGYTAAPGESPPPDGTPENCSEVRGQFTIGETIPVDLKGNPLSPEEARRREQQKATQLNDQDSSQRSRSGSSATATARSPPFQPMPKSSGSCCSHRTAVAKEKQEAAQPASEGLPRQLQLTHTSAKPPTSAVFHGCNCGATCSCAFCPQHPNNQVSQNLARQHANMFMNHSQSSNANLNFMQLTSDSIPQRSCMGPVTKVLVGAPSTLANPADMQQHFPSNGHGVVMEYRLERRPPSALQASTYNHNADTIPGTNQPLAISNPTEQHNPWNNFYVQDATLYSGEQGSWMPDLSSEQLLPEPADPHTTNFLSAHLDVTHFGELVQADASFEAIALPQDIVDQYDQVIHEGQNEFIGTNLGTETAIFEPIHHPSGLMETPRHQHFGPLLPNSTHNQLVGIHQGQSGTGLSNVGYAPSTIPYQTQHGHIFNDPTYDYSQAINPAQSAYFGPPLSGSPNPIFGWP